MCLKSIDVFEIPFNLGLRKKPHEGEPGVKGMPDWVKSHDLYNKLSVNKVLHIPAPPYVLDFNEETRVLNAVQVSEFAKRQAKVVGEEFNNNNFNLIIGGDCSILVGTALALKKRGAYGLLFLDGHTDFITPTISKTGAIAGMDLAIVTGMGEKVLTNIDDMEPYFKEEHVFCIGNREYEDSYIAPILDSKVHYYDLKKVRSLGIDNIVNRFDELVRETKLDGFFIHFDVDVIDDKLMPAVDSRQEDGFSYEEMNRLLHPVVRHPLCIGMEITILDPSLDKDGKATKGLVQFLTSLLDK